MEIKITKDIDIFGYKMPVGATAKKTGDNVVLLISENKNGAYASFPLSTIDRFGKSADEVMSEIENQLTN